MTESMRRAIDETKRRREIQEAYNLEHNIPPRSVAKGVDQGLRSIIPAKDSGKNPQLDYRKIPRDELPSIIRELGSQMELHSANLEFEKAAELRDLIADIKQHL